MTNKEQSELIAQARELCETRVAEKRDELNELDKFNAQHPNHLVNYDRERAEIVADLSAWNTHLAEIDELIAEHEHYIDKGHSCENEFYCEVMNDLLTKAERLLGVE